MGVDVVPSPTERESDTWTGSRVACLSWGPGIGGQLHPPLGLGLLGEGERLLFGEQRTDIEFHMTWR